jgi:hypothetical protein
VEIAGKWPVFLGGGACRWPDYNRSLTRKGNKKAFTIRQRLLNCWLEIYQSVVVKCGYFNFVQWHTAMAQQLFLLCQLAFFLETALYPEYPFLFRLTSFEDAHYGPDSEGQ